MSLHILIASAMSFFELTMVSNNHTNEVRDASENFPHFPKHSNASLFRSYARGLLSGFPYEGRRSNYPPLLGHMEGGCTYIVVSLMREGD